MQNDAYHRQEFLNMCRRLAENNSDLEELEVEMLEFYLNVNFATIDTGFMCDGSPNKHSRLLYFVCIHDKISAATT
jgi:hypothetical protein